MSTVTLGGERLGSGKKQKVHLKEYERSTHDMSYVWRSTMSAGTLVPFIKEVALPGDTFDIDLNADIMTHPTIGPLFGSYKVQLDVFQIPIRLYNGKLHMNMLEIGMDMKNVKLPQLEMIAPNPDLTGGNIDNYQINPSCILSYLGTRGIGKTTSFPNTRVEREINAVPLLMYWDIYKNYYANKQEEIGAVIHHPYETITNTIINIKLYERTNTTFVEIPQTAAGDINVTWGSQAKIVIQFDAIGYVEFDPARISLSNDGVNTKITDLFTIFNWDEPTKTLTATGINPEYSRDTPPFITRTYTNYQFEANYRKGEVIAPQIKTFPLKNIDDMKIRILTWSAQAGRLLLQKSAASPYGDLLQWEQEEQEVTYTAAQGNQEGLGLKTYQSDLLQNWISTEWIDGENGVNEITKISTADGGFTINELNLANKIYNMLNRIAISGGTYDDWLDATYSHDRARSVENPVYMGGLIKELVFQEVVSNAASTDGQPLGTLAGRGTLAGKHKGGKIRIKTDEPSYIMGIVSLTPRIDYSQGNKWDTNLKTMDDFHKPALDEIGFQDLITEQMAWWDTDINLVNDTPIYRSAGKQPAWINYQTNVNQVLGNFADESQQMFMVLARRYEIENNGEYFGIKDLTTYIDPAKFNYIFADTRRDAQNFWVQISVDMITRRKMSARVIPNL